jgi:hypothetical protein
MLLLLFCVKIHIFTYNLNEFRILKTHEQMTHRFAAQLCHTSAPLHFEAYCSLVFTERVEDAVNKTTRYFKSPVYYAPPKSLPHDHTIGRLLTQQDRKGCTHTTTQHSVATNSNFKRTLLSDLTMPWIGGCTLTREGVPSIYGLH